MFSFPLSLRPEPESWRICIAWRQIAGKPAAYQDPFASEARSTSAHRNGQRLAKNRASSLEKAARGQAGSLRMAGAAYRTRAISRSLGFFMSVVGASRRSAAPGGRSVGAAGYGSLILSRRRVGAIGGKRSRPYRLASSEARHRALPNPSIERTAQGLRPRAASHVKR
jgi:hypothetical protein